MVRGNREDVMECQRCQGLMVQDRAYDLQDTNIHCDVWRCVCCGNIFDTLILMNQRNLRSQFLQKQEVSSIQELTAA